MWPHAKYAFLFLLSLACFATSTIPHSLELSDYSSLIPNDIICPSNSKQPICTIYQYCTRKNQVFIGNEEYCHPLSLLAGICTAKIKPTSEWVSPQICGLIHLVCQDNKHSACHAFQQLKILPDLNGLENLIKTIELSNSTHSTISSDIPTNRELSQIISSAHQGDDLSWLSSPLAHYIRLCQNPQQSCSLLQVSGSHGQLSSDNYYGEENACYIASRFCSISPNSPLCISTNHSDVSVAIYNPHYYLTNLISSLEQNPSEIVTLISDKSVCLDNNTLPECVDYIYPENEANLDVLSICNLPPDRFHNMIGCDIMRGCVESNNRAPYCQSFSIIVDVCAYDMPKMRECANFQKLCSTGSVVKQCKSSKLAPVLPSTKEVKVFIKDICSKMPMSSCNECTDYNSRQCNLLETYSNLCMEMPGMPQCKKHHEICKLIPDDARLCPNNANQHPSMIMYFHLSFREYVLFKNMVPDSLFQYALAIFFIVCLVILLECLRVASRYVDKHTFNPRDYRNGRFPWKVRRDLPKSLLRTLELGVAYLIMLLAMSYNIGFFIAILLGTFIATLSLNRLASYNTMTGVCPCPDDHC